MTKDNIDEFWTPSGVPAEAVAPKEMCTPADEATVKPVDQKPAQPMKIAVLGLENNPFWIPVKEGTLKAAEELAPYGVTVEWIVPGDQHTSEVFGQAVESAIVKKYDAIATVAGDAGMVPFINKAVDAGIPVATFNSETAEPNKRLFFVGADLYLQGQAAGKAMAEAIGGKGKVAIITGLLRRRSARAAPPGLRGCAQEGLPGCHDPAAGREPGQGRHRLLAGSRTS